MGDRIRHGLFSSLENLGFDMLETSDLASSSKIRPYYLDKNAAPIIDQESLVIHFEGIGYASVSNIENRRE